jgi:hypothetical protein
MAELNLLDGSVAGTAVASKALALGSNKNVDTLVIADGGLKLGAGAGTAVSATAAELNLIDGSVAGTAVASKALVLGADKNVDTLAIADGGLKLGAGAGTAVSATAAELNYNDIATLGTGAASKTLVLDANGRYRLPSTGTFFNAGKQTKAQAAPAAKTVTAAITAAELVAGLITTTGATAPSEHQLPTGTEIDTAFPDIATGDSFDFTIINTGTGASDDATITVNTDVTIVGNPTVGALTDATILSGSGTFRARRTGANTYVVYRIA